MSIVEAIILGILQGLTEFLPVSSSGHLEIGGYLLNIEATDNILFAIVVHAATALSTIVVFRKDLFSIIKDFLKFENNESTHYVFKIILSMVPVGIVGVFFEDQIDDFFGGKIVLVGSMLLVTALLLLFTHFYKSKEGNVTYLKAFIIGLAQAFAILPGISRSGATISTALLLDVERSKAARFSFLMVIIPILGAAFLKVISFLKEPATAGSISGFALTAGFLSAFFAGLLACTWMINIVKRGKLYYFAIYCFMVGMIAILSQLS